MAACSRLPGNLLSALCSETAVASNGKTVASAGTLGETQTSCPDNRRCRMSAMLASPCIVATATAVAESELPVGRPKPIVGFEFYRKHTVGLLRHYAQVSMELGQPQSALGKMVLRGRVSSYRLRTFEDGLVFVLDVEKCIKQLDRTSRRVVAFVAVEDYTMMEAVTLTGQSLRSIARIYGEAMDRLTDLFLRFGLLGANVENLSSAEAKNQSNETT